MGQYKESCVASLSSPNEVICRLASTDGREELPSMHSRIIRIRETVRRDAQASSASLAQGDAGPHRAISILKTTRCPMCHRQQLSSFHAVTALQTDVEALPSMEQMLGQHVKLKTVKKIGEGTFAEAFKGSSVVFKIMPMEGKLLVSVHLCASRQPLIFMNQCCADVISSGMEHKRLTSDGLLQYIPCAELYARLQPG